MISCLKKLWPKEWPSENKWKRFPEVLNKTDKLIFVAIIMVATFCFGYICFSFYISQTSVSPVHGGVYREGFVGSYRWLVLNPIYSSRSDTERDIIEILYSGLMGYDKNGNIVPELATYTEEDGRIFTVTLKDDLYWSDGEKITSEDIVFTIQTIQDPTFGSTLYQQWMGVQTEKISDTKVRFKLDSPSSIFLENLTLKIIPEHIWSNIPAKEFSFSIYNMEVVGSGPYKYNNTVNNNSGEIETIHLEKNPYYFKSAAYINNISLLFFPTKEELLSAKDNGLIDGFSNGINYEEQNFTTYEFTLPRYFAVIFNTNDTAILNDVTVRKALNYATNKEELLNRIVGGKGEIVNSPFLIDTDNPYPYHPEKARELLEEAGFKDGHKNVEEEVIFLFEKDIRDQAQGENVRALQRCFISLTEEYPQLYPNGEVTGFFGEETKQAVTRFQEIYREDILDPWGFDSGTGIVSTTTRAKLNELCSTTPSEIIPLKINIHTVNQEIMISVAKELQRQWSEFGIDVHVIEEDVHTLERDIIKTREYQSILFGTAFTSIINPLPLWHSSKIEDSGLNLSGYSSDDADKLIENIIKDSERKIALRAKSRNN